MNIPRPDLLRELSDFATFESGVVVGAPGAGKTFTLKQLCEKWQNERDVLYLPIDRLSTASEGALQNDLGIDGDLIEYLRRNRAFPGEKAILIIDAFDAARSDFAQTFVLSLVRRVMTNLGDEWNVMVSVRIYDARKSQSLQDLFPFQAKPNPSSDYSIQSIRCRHFLIPTLSDDEVVRSFQHHPDMLNVYYKSQPEFKTLLRIPFNLWLLEKLISDKTELPGLSTITSSVELLNSFWSRRVVEGEQGEERRVLLGRAAEVMISQKSLSARRDDLYISSASQAWESLLSRELLAYTSDLQQRVAFYHNILFDYAVSVLLIEDSSEQFLNFVNADTSRPLFLRPSLTYYFTRLWYSTPSKFWEIFWSLLQSTQIKARILARLIPITVIVNEVHSFTQLEDLVRKLKEGAGFAPEAIQRLLQGLTTFGESSNDAVWSEFFEALSDSLDSVFLWDLVSYSSRICSRAEPNSTIYRRCAHIGRRAFAWAWNLRTLKPNAWLDGLIATQIIPLIARTYSTDAAESRVLLSNVFKLVEDSTFPIDFVFRLVNELEPILKIDPLFVLEIYILVFGYEEKSTEVTSMGGYVLPLTSNRRQDWGMCRYVLIQAFPTFLNAFPEIASHAAIQVVDNFIYYEHLRNLSERPHQTTFSFAGGKAIYQPDYSYIWDQGHRDEAIELADHLFRFFEQSTANSDSSPILLSAIRSYGTAAFWWKRLLEMGARNPKTLALRLFDLTIARPIQTNAETLHALGEFLQAAASEFSKSQQKDIEESLLGIVSEGSDQKRRDGLARCRDRLLGQIRPELLATEAARVLVEELRKDDRLPSNEPLAKISGGYRSYTEEDWLTEQGADLTDKDAQHVLQMSTPLERFTSEWNNRITTSDAITSISPFAKELYSYLETTRLTGPVVDSAWSKLASCVATMSKGISGSDAESYPFCVTVLLACANHRLPEPNEEYDSNYNFASWSSLPRNEAAIGIPWLVVRGQNKQLLSVIRQLCSDKVPSVRMLSVMELWRTVFIDPDFFFNTALQIAENESNRVVQQALARSLRSVIYKNEDRVVAILQVLIPHLIGDGDEEESTVDDVSISLLTWLSIVKKNIWALQVIDTWLSAPLKHSKLLNRLTFEVSGYLTPEKAGSQEDFTGEAITWFSRLIDAGANAISDVLKVAKERNNDADQQKDAYYIIHNLISRLYFAADVEPKLRRAEKTPLTDEQRSSFYFKIKPLLLKVLPVNQDKGDRILLAPTAHHLMELLHGVLEYDPAGVLQLAALAASASEPFGYNLDPLATKEVVGIAEQILADHRSSLVSNNEALEDLLLLLDTFAKTGWPEALQLVWRLDELFR